MCASADRAARPRAAIDYPAAMGLCLFALTHFTVLFLIEYIAAQHAEPGATEEQRRTAFSVSVLFIAGATLLALGSHAAALAWTRRRFRYVAAGVLLGLEVVIAALSAGLTVVLLVGATTGQDAQVMFAELLLALLGPANVTLAVYGLVNAVKSRHR